MTLYHVAEADETDADVEMFLNEIKTRLSQKGVSEAVIDIEISRGDADQEMIIEAADNHDGIVMGESDPSVTTFLFGMTADQVAKRFLDPMFVIQHEETDANEPAEAK